VVGSRVPVHFGHDVKSLQKAVWQLHCTCSNKYLINQYNYEDVPCIYWGSLIASCLVSWILWCSRTGHHPQDRLSKFGNRSERKVKVLKNRCYIFATSRNLLSKYGYLKKSHKVWWLWQHMGQRLGQLEHNIKIEIVWPKTNFNTIFCSLKKDLVSERKYLILEASKGFFYFKSCLLAGVNKSCRQIPFYNNSFESLLAGRRLPTQKYSSNSKVKVIWGSVQMGSIAYKYPFSSSGVPLLASPERGRDFPQV
jgi:hypothetical protein